MPYKTYSSTCKAPTDALKKRATTLSTLRWGTRADDQEYMRIQRVLAEREEHKRHVQLLAQQID